MDMLDSPARGEVPFTISPSPVVGVACWLANRILLLAKSLSQQNRQPLLNILLPSAKGEYGSIDSVQFDDEDTPKKRHLNYLERSLGHRRRGNVELVLMPRTYKTLSLRQCVRVLALRA